MFSPSSLSSLLLSLLQLSFVRPSIMLLLPVVGDKLASERDHSFIERALKLVARYFQTERISFVTGLFELRVP